VVEVASFGGAIQPAWSGTSGVFTGAVTTSYDANFTTVTDQAGKVRRSMVDALGRLRRLDEPDNTSALGSTINPTQPTSYNYDVLGNLTTVTQGTQIRTFTYDSLTRLRTAINPESGTVNYQYDDNGNLLVKTNARTDSLDANKKVNTHFEYDALNRVTRRWYNGSSSITATTHLSPSLPSGVGATEEARFFYDTQALPAGAPSYSRGTAVGMLVARTYGTGSNGDYYAYDVLGRTTLKIQQTGTVNYQVSAVYTLSGALNTLTYPSGRTVNNTYDQAGRLTTLTGNLGDGLTRTYASGILYSPIGGLVKEQFGTATPVFNKLFYNSRSQLAELRASTSYTGPTDYDANRGAIVNDYSDQCSGICSGASMPDNNGNLKKQQIQVATVQTKLQQYEYDSLNRLKSARELVSGVEQWKQQFTYDRWGNRLIDTAATFGIGINNTAFEKLDAANQLYAPGDLALPMAQRRMRYDATGNLTHDTYTGAGNRTYDAENKITSAWGGNNQAQLYSYDAAGQRIKRTVDGVETWQVYGFGGELLAEYPAGGAAANPQKEYGYRNGQLLVTASAPSRLNVASSTNGATATASETHSAPYAASGAINGDRKLYTNNAWANVTATYPQWLQVDFNGSRVIDEVDVFSIQDNPSSPSEPTLSLTFNNYGVTAFQVQYWNGSSWITVPNGQVTGNNRVWKQITFSPIATNKIKVIISGSADGYSRLAEVEAWGISAGSGADLRWLISDHLGTPRMILDQTGAVNNMTRHDYLPFGEELFAPTGGRSTAQGYSASNGIRQQFTGQERDSELNLDFFKARFYNGLQGRFIGVDPGPLTPADPQNFNRYTYVQNNPLKFIDPNGTDLTFLGGDADYMLAELARFTGLALKRDATTGMVTIDSSKKRNQKGTSTWFANKVIQVVQDARASVKIEFVRSAPTVFFDQYISCRFDVDDYNAFKRADDKFAAESFAHFIEEYYYEQ
jgi:RHS repeat-associated protein